ncbi:MAG TPA: hypothetical protein ENK94_03010 [Campylobacterales bacterium]|nr:hypothetical protein [Campylobacterales bacterium]
MKNIFLSMLLIVGMATFATGCSKNCENATAKKCDSAKCGASAKKCGDAKDAKKCGASGKCGSK